MSLQNIYITKLYKEDNKNQLYNVHKATLSFQR